VGREATLWRSLGESSRVGQDAFDRITHGHDLSDHAGDLKRAPPKASCLEICTTAEGVATTSYDLAGYLIWPNFGGTLLC
jgi:hypothetical protein